MRSLGRFRFLDVPAGADTRPRGTLLLVHGFPLTPAMWQPQLGLAAHGWRIVVPELRGFGSGAGDPPTASMDDYASDIIDLVDALHIEDAVVGGLSMGGYIAFALFRHAPHYVRAMILADTRSQADTPDGVEGRKRMQQLARERGAEAVATELLPKLVGDTTRREQPAVVDELRTMISGNSVDSIVGALQALMTRADATPLLSSIRCPVLVIVGAEDAITPPPLSEQMHKDIAGSQLIVIEGAGHMSNMEQPARFNEALARFLDHRV